MRLRFCTKCRKKQSLDVVAKQAALVSVVHQSIPPLTNHLQSLCLLGSVTKLKSGRARFLHGTSLPGSTKGLIFEVENVVFLSYLVAN